MIATNDTFCGNCKYDLSGSPSIGSCPECGHYFNRRSGEGLLNLDEPVDAKGDRVMRLVVGISLMVFAAILLGCGGLIAYLQQRGRPFWIMAVIAMVVIMAAATKLLKERGPR